MLDARLSHSRVALRSSSSGVQRANGTDRRTANPQQRSAAREWDRQTGFWPGKRAHCSKNVLSFQFSVTIVGNYVIQNSNSIPTLHIINQPLPAYTPSTKITAISATMVTVTGDVRPLPMSILT